VSFRDEALLVFDGACGSNIQLMHLPAAVWGPHEGCNEYLNLSAPEAVEGLHRSFLEAGAMVLETNTFGASRVVLAEYGLEGEVERINRAAVEHARRAIAGRPRRYVAGSMGPTTKLPSLGHIGFGAMLEAYREQARALVEAGVDALILETCQDLLQAKIGVLASLDVLEATGRDVPILVSVTVERTGTMLTGADLAAAVAALEPYPLFSLGLNCATGPDDMAPHVRLLSRTWPGRISVIPNAGLPELVAGKTVYALSPGDFAARLGRYVAEDGVSVVGGCCGTRPEHIAALVATVGGLEGAARAPRYVPSLSSAYLATEIRQEPPPLLIGERANANGSRQFRKLLLADDLDGALAVGLEQERDGAHAADLCTAYAGRDELADLTAMTRRFASTLKIPTVIDSTTPAVIEACLELHPGRCLVNSINLEDGGANLDRVCRAVKRFGAAVIALTISERGMALTADEKVETARAIHALAVGRHGLRPSDLFFDPLTFTVGSGDESLRNAAKETLAAIGRIKAELPGVNTVLGLSNVSFGLDPRSRRVLNAVFLHEAVAAGLDAAIIDAGKVLPFASIPEADREVCLDLLYDRARDDAAESPLMAFIAHFARADASASASTSASTGPRLMEERLARHVVAGDAEGIEDVLSVLMRRRTPLGIINEILVPAMRHVGELFGRGELLLPFVLKSAEVMKRCVTVLEPFMDRSSERAGLRAKVLLATVQGDVHDIGKNLVDILLSNNGYRVFNLGIKVPAATIIEKAREHEVDVIGLSGLLVKSAIVMKESLPQYREAGLRVPILLGGAALTRKFVAESCAPAYDGPVVYCADAFAGLKALQEHERGALRSTTFDAGAAVAAARPGPREQEIDRSVPVPEPPFLGARVVRDLDPAALFPYVNEQALFRGRWGYRRGKLSAAEYEALVTDTVLPAYEALKARAIAERLIEPRVVYGWFQARSDGDAVIVTSDGREHRFEFPRQAEPPHLCIADFFKTADEGGDVAGFFVVTVGDRIGHAARELFEADRYQDYLHLHGFGVECTDALAEHWHEVMRVELGIGARRPATTSGYAAQDYQGSRYGFGYPACPDLGAHRPVFELLRPGEIGVTLTENFEMVPEQTTSALVVHHRQAKYFAV
jgi:5-methyltetrahydrofolate--homocysteine methyltransferase